MDQQTQPAAEADPLAEKVRDHLVAFLGTLDPEKTLMAFISGPQVADAIGEPVGLSSLARGAALLSSSAFSLTPRDSDDFCDAPYLWVAPRPPAQPAGDSPAKPDRCWVIRSPDGRSSLREKQGLLVFSQSGFATSYATQAGLGDFDLVSLTWAELVEQFGPRHGTAILDHVSGRPMRIVPIE